MAQNKTVKNDLSVSDYLAAITPEQKQRDAHWLLKCCERITGEKASMWGSSIVGAGSYHYKYASGREGDMPLAAFASRSSTLVIYLGGIIPEQAQLLTKLGPHRMGKACLHIKKLEQIDLRILETLMVRNIEVTRQKYPEQGQH